uniref:GAF domain-containing protein n=1 Tax=mine drainage metagenome TaxID=410659 RepID=E6PRX1_9ZZZZ
MDLAWRARRPSIEPQIMAGPARAYAQALRIHRGIPTVQEPVFQALLHQTTNWIQASADPLSAPTAWHEAAARFGFRQAMALPLHLRQSGQYGVVVCSTVAAWNSP